MSRGLGDVYKRQAYDYLVKAIKQHIRSGGTILLTNHQTEIPETKKVNLDEKIS